MINEDATNTNLDKVSMITVLELKI